MPHQWLEGNLPVSAKCVVCDKNCGSVRRLQDWRCLWCKTIVSEMDRLLDPVLSHRRRIEFDSRSYLMYFNMFNIKNAGRRRVEVA